MTARFHLDDRVLAISVFAITALLAWHFGWLNDDAQNYLGMATHIAKWEGIAIRPSWGDNYWAVFPFGYPLIVAIVSKLVGSAFAASKLVNFCFIVGSVFLAARWLHLPLLAVAALFSTAWLLEILSYSWSENSFIFGHILALASLHWFLVKGEKKWLYYFALGLFIAVSSRYIGGFMLVGYLAVLALYYRRDPRTNILPPLKITLSACVCFALYLIINIPLTGNATGMERSPAREGFTFLALQFIEYLFYSVWMIIPALLMLRIKKPNSEFSPAWPPLLLGACYLVVLFVLRNISSFEQFSGRMLSPGMILIWLGVMHSVCADPQLLGKRARVIFVVAFAINFCVLYKDVAKFPNIPFTESAKRSHAIYEEKYGALRDGTIAISIGTSEPSVGWNYVSPIFGTDRVFYLLLDSSTQTLPELRAYIARLQYKKKPPRSYVFDFTAFPDQASFEKALAAKKLQPDVARWIKSYFSASTWVECAECNTPLK